MAAAKPRTQTVKDLNKAGGRNKPAGGLKVPNTAAPAPLKPKWMVDNEEAAQCFISDEQLQRAKKAFFETDQDGSGSIDVNELGLMLKKLGQNPTEEELHKMMKDADSSGNMASGDGNGKIEIREFLKWYGKIFNSARNLEEEDIMDAYRAFGGTEQKTTIDKEDIRNKLHKEYDLDVASSDLDNFFPTKEVNVDSFREALGTSIAAVNKKS
jgi:Ca2+-binding EF-hand superfamily protein